ncbi:MAG: hypothetical protein OQJ84_10405 [Xanthomonadales bacterium]|nr:hypothetical protein [Xanthomonadales bacterium]
MNGEVSSLTTLLSRTMALLAVFILTAVGPDHCRAAGATTGNDGEERIVFYSNRDGNDEIYVVRPDGKDLRRLTFNDADDGAPAWSPDGTHIAFASDRHEAGSGQCSPACPDQIFIMRADGSGPSRLTQHEGVATLPAWSQDGRHIAYTVVEGERRHIWVMNADGSDQRRLMTSPGEDLRPRFSPDGTELVFTRLLNGDMQLFLVNADGTNLRQITNGPRWNVYASWSPDGTTFAFASLDPNDFEAEIHLIEVDGSNERALTDEAGRDEDAEWSPDGKRIVFQTPRRGSYDIWVMNADGSGQRQITDHPAGDYWPDWTDRATRYPDPE